MLKHSVVCLCMVFLALSSRAATPKPIEILTPAGGEFYVVGSKQRVRLNPKTSSKSVAIELSTDGGATFGPLGTIDNTVKDKTKRNVLEFTVPNTASGNCVIRATAGTVSSTSPGFSIGGAVVATGGVTIPAAQISSGASADGTVLAADGSGGASFTSLEGKFVKVAGDTMTGALTLSGNPAADLHAATKQYVDAETVRATAAEAGLTVGVSAETVRATAAEAGLTASVNTKVSKAGDTMSGLLELNSAAGDDFTLAGAAARYNFDADSTGLKIREAVSGSSAQIFSCNAATGDISLGGNGRINCNGDNSVRVDGAFTLEGNVFNNNFTANNSTCCFFCNSANNSITITLPNPATTPLGRIYIIKKISSNNSVTISSPTGTIEGATSIAMTAVNDFRFIVCAGAIGGWQVIGRQ